MSWAYDAVVHEFGDGLADVQYQLRKSDGTVTQAWTHTGVIELARDATNSDYTVPLSFADGWRGVIQWRNDGSAPTRYASEAVTALTEHVVRYLAAQPAVAGDAMALTSGERTTLTGVIWAALTSGLTTVGSVGKLIVDNLNAAITSRSSHSAADVTGGTTVAGAVTSIKGADGDTLKILSDQMDGVSAKTDNLPEGFKKNTAYSNFTFTMENASGTLLTNLTVTAQRSLDGAAFAACSNAVSEMTDGWYKINLAAADMNGDSVALRFSATGAKDLDISIKTEM